MACFLRRSRLTYGMPLIVELGIFFDVLVAAMVLGILIYRIRENFESMDVEPVAEVCEDRMLLIALLLVLSLIPLAAASYCLIDAARANGNGQSGRIRRWSFLAAVWLAAQFWPRDGLVWQTAFSMPTRSAPW